MSFNTIGDAIKSKSREITPPVSEVSIFKNLIKERAHALALIRELLSNSGALQVGATKIEISYTRDKDVGKWGTSYNPPVKRKIFSCDFGETENRL